MAQESTRISSAWELIDDIYMIMHGHLSLTSYNILFDAFLQNQHPEKVTNFFSGVEK